MVTLLSLQLATVLFVVLSIQRQTSTQFTANARGLLDQLADSVTDQVQRFLGPAQTVLEIGQQLIAGGVLDATSDVDLERFFASQLKSNSRLKGIYLGREDGSFVYVNRNLQDALQAKRVMPVDGAQRSIISELNGHHAEEERSWRDIEEQYDPRKRPWFELARDTNGIGWTSAYLFHSSGLPGISASVEVEDLQGHDRGVLGVDLDIQELSSAINNIPGTDRGTAAIIDEQLNAVALSNTTRLSVGADRSSIPDMQHVKDPVLRTLYQRIEKSKDADDASHKVFGIVDTEQGEHLTLSRALSMFDGHVNWRLLVQAPVKDFQGSLAEFFRSRIRALVLVILLPGFLAVWAIMRLTRPVYRLHRDATIDSLTGAMSRAEFDRCLNHLVHDRRRRTDGTRLVALVLDLDGFKRVNDQHGHTAGDKILKTVVTRLTGALRKDDLLGRTGGDEFQVIMHVSASTDIGETVECLHRKIVDTPITFNGQPLRIGVTIGIAELQADEALERLLNRADQALIRGKRIAKNACYQAVAPVMLLRKAS